MIFRGTRGVLVFFFLYIFHQVFSGVAGEIVVNENGSFQNKTIFETLNNIGPKQCVRECQRRDYCKAVNYRREHLECQLLWTSVSNTSELEPHEKYQFINMASQTEVIKECSKYCKDRQCVHLSSDQDYCVANTCPLGYKYNRTLQFCYLDLDIRFDYDGGTAYCESIGSRLAIVPTRKHHIHLREERSKGFLLDKKFRVGGAFNITTGQWQWSDGSMVFSSIKRTETRVEIDEGDLLWDELEIFRDLESGRTERILCERVI
ncbi:uncharacterized protein LOC144624916 [Crassostrea virginica]